MKFALGVSLLLLGTGKTWADPEIVRDDQLKFRVVLPAGFTEVPTVTAWVSYRFDRDTAHPERNLSIGIVAVGARRDPILITPEDAVALQAKDPRAEVFVARWKNRDVNVVRKGFTDFTGAPHISYEVVLPVDRLPIQVTMSGPEAKDAEAREVLLEVIKNFDGTPSQLPTEFDETHREPSVRQSTGIKNIHGDLASGSLLVGIGWAWWRIFGCARRSTTAGSLSGPAHGA